MRGRGNRNKVIGGTLSLFAAVCPRLFLHSEFEKRDLHSASYQHFNVLSYVLENPEKRYVYVITDVVYRGMVGLLNIGK